MLSVGFHMIVLILEQFYRFLNSERVHQVVLVILVGFYLQPWLWNHAGSRNFFLFSLLVWGWCIPFVQTLQQDHSLFLICIDEEHVNLGPTDRISIPNSHILQSTKFNSALKFAASVQKNALVTCFRTQVRASIYDISSVLVSVATCKLQHWTAICIQHLYLTVCIQHLYLNSNTCIAPRYLFSHSSCLVFWKITSCCYLDIYSAIPFCALIVVEQTIELQIQASCGFGVFFPNWRLREKNSSVLASPAAYQETETVLSTRYLYLFKSTAPFACS